MTGSGPRNECRWCFFRRWTIAAPDCFYFYYCFMLKVEKIFGWFIKMQPGDCENTRSATAKHCQVPVKKKCDERHGHWTIMGGGMAHMFLRNFQGNWQHPKFWIKSSPKIWAPAEWSDIFEAVFCVWFLLLLSVFCYCWLKLFIDWA